MIQVMSVTAVAICENCRCVIKRGRGDLETVERWWHASSGLETCPGSPVATPKPHSIRKPARPAARTGGDDG